MLVAIGLIIICALDALPGIALLPGQNLVEKGNLYLALRSAKLKRS